LYTYDYIKGQELAAPKIENTQNVERV